MSDTDAVEHIFRTGEEGGEEALRALLLPIYRYLHKFQFIYCFEGDSKKVDAEVAFFTTTKFTYKFGTWRSRNLGARL